MVYQLCQAYQSLPEPGGVLEQSVALLRMHVILNDGGYFDKTSTAPSTGLPADPFAGLPMEAL